MSHLLDKKPSAVERYVVNLLIGALVFAWLVALVTGVLYLVTG